MLIRVVMLLVGAGFMLYGLNAARSGVFHDSESGAVNRAVEPATFWWHVAAAAGAGLFLIIAGIIPAPLIRFLDRIL